MVSKTLSVYLNLSALSAPILDGPVTDTKQFDSLKTTMFTYKKIFSHLLSLFLFFILEMLLFPHFHLFSFSNLKTPACANPPGEFSLASLSPTLWLPCKRYPLLVTLILQTSRFLFLWVAGGETGVWQKAIWDEAKILKYSCSPAGGSFMGWYWRTCMEVACVHTHTHVSYSYN